jgi:hypothetical protein
MSERVVLEAGALVTTGEWHYRIHQILDLETVLAYDSQFGNVKRLTISELVPILPSSGEVGLVPNPVIQACARSY